MELTAVMVLMFLLHLCHSFGNTMIDLGGRVFKKGKDISSWDFVFFERRCFLHLPPPLVPHVRTSSQIAKRRKDRFLSEHIAVCIHAQDQPPCKTIYNAKP